MLNTHLSMSEQKVLRTQRTCSGGGGGGGGGGVGGGATIHPVCTSQNLLHIMTINTRPSTTLLGGLVPWRRRTRCSAGGGGGGGGGGGATIHPVCTSQNQLLITRINTRPSTNLQGGLVPWR